MKLILNSRGLNTKTGTVQIQNAINEDTLSEKRIFICSFPDYEIDEKILKNCMSMGFEGKNILFSKDGIPDEPVDYVHVTEGNTFIILKYMRENSISPFIIESCKSGAVYLGSSAGAIIAGVDCKFALDFDSNCVGINDYTGLGLFDGIILPHYTEEQLKRYILEADYELINSYKKVYNVDNDNVLILISEGN